MTLSWTCRACRVALLRQRTARSHHTARRSIITQSKFFRISEEVQQAIAERKPVVALETTIYTHGFPYPDNLALASKLDSVVRENGGVPATIGVLDGVARVGMTTEQLDRLISSPGSANLLKVSRRDLGFVTSLKGTDGRPLNGGTTISGTMILAHLAGINIFGTGGLGGVHRGAEQTFDISADLTELGRTPVTVISSGSKSFLDIPKTLEYLETQGVAVATFADGRPGSVDFPAFYARESGVKSPMVLKDELEAARVIHAQNSLGLQSGLLFANPIPEEHAVPFETMENAINEALAAGAAAGLSGAAITPYILAKIKEITGSKSVEANRALVIGNLARAAKVAAALQRLELEGDVGVDEPRSFPSAVVGPGAAGYTTDGVPSPLAKDYKQQHAAATEHKPENTSPTAPSSNSLGTSIDLASLKASFQSAVNDVKDIISSSSAPANVFVAGSLAVDLSCDFTPRSGSTLQSPELQTSNPARIGQSLGGVGHNVARAAHLMGANVRLCSAVADDLTGKAALEALAFAEMSTAGVKILPGSDGNRTAQYVAINDSKKDLVLAMADMSILERPSTESNTIPSTFSNFWIPQLQASKPTHLVLDGNWPPEYLAPWLSAAKDISAHITFEPVSTSKSTGPFNLPKSTPQINVYPSPSIHLSTPNIHELSSMHTAASTTHLFQREDWWPIIDALGLPSTGSRTKLSLATSPALVDQGIPQQTIQLLPFIPTICVKLGSAGVLLTILLPAHDTRLHHKDYAPYILSRCNNGSEDNLGVGGVYMRLFPAVKEVKGEDVVSVNGVGDTFAGVLVAGLAKQKAEGKEGRVEDLIDLAQRAAVLTLKSQESVSPGLGTLRVLL